MGDYYDNIFIDVASIKIPKDKYMKFLVEWDLISHYLNFDIKDFPHKYD